MQLMDRILFRRAKDKGFFQRCDMWFWHVAEHEQQGRVNLVDPSHVLTNTNMTWAATSGFTGNGTDSLLATGKNANALTYYAQDSASMFVWPLTNVGEGKQDLSCATTAYASVTSRNGTDFVSTRGNSTVGFENTATTNSIAHVGWTRIGSAEYAQVRNGSETLKTRASTALIAEEIQVGRGNSGSSSRAQGMSWVGGGLGAALLGTHNEVGDFYRICRDYMEALGIV
jgi:hypothetical protein